MVHELCVSMFFMIECDTLLHIKQEGLGMMQIHTKAEWRAYALGRRDALSAEERRAKSDLICSRIIRSSWLAAIQARVAYPTVLVYWPFRSEVDIRPFIAWAWRHSWVVAAPRVDRDRAGMSFYKIYGSSDLHPGAYGIMEPDPKQPLLADDATAELIVVPGAALDRKGNRIGYGGGYYDKKFEQLLHANQHEDKHPLRIAPVFDVQLFPGIPAEKHDMTMHVIMTEKEEIVTAT